MRTMAQRVVEFGISVTVEHTGAKLPEGFDRYGNAWKIRFRSNGKQYTMPMFTGSALGEPDVIEALNCLVMDASCYYTSSGYLDFCEEFGYDSNDDKYRRIYDSCKRQFNNLERLVGTRNALSLIENTERL